MMTGDMDDLTDRIIGPFRVVRSLGVGSTGEVLLAERMASFPQRVAIKVLAASEDVTSDGVAAAGNAHEASVLVALDHPHIVKLVDRGTLPRGRRYLVMEYVDGEPIDVYCARHQCTSQERARLLVKVMDALAHAHAHLVIHTDLKPPNILVAADGEPKLLDFGVAQWQGRRGPAGLTPAFASPEQRAGEPLSAASDIYSLGLIAGGLLSGDRGRDLDSIVATATAPVADDRYASIDAFKADLLRYLDGRDVSVRPLSPMGSALRWVQRHRLAAATVFSVLLMLAVAAGGVIRNAAQAARQRALAESQLHELVSLTGTLEGDLYESVRRLPQSQEAKRILLQGAGATLAVLATRDDKDSILALELARQYSTLARLELAEAGGADAPVAARQTALGAVDSGIRLLLAVDRGDPQYAEAQRELDVMRRWRAAAFR
jgi:serine/threonine-protein kinase